LTRPRRPKRSRRPRVSAPASASVIAARRRTRVRDVRDDYLAFIDSLNGTRAEKSPATIEDITGKLDNYILPAIGHLRISELDERDIRKLALSAHNRSRSTVHAILSVS
jgi:hypothetical protein